VTEEQNGGRRKKVLDALPGQPAGTPRSVVALATLGLVVVTICAVGALAYDVIFRGGDTAALVSVASITVGALATLAGAGAGRRQEGDQQ